MLQSDLRSILKGVELANGFRELTDAKEQRLRFERDNRQRVLPWDYLNSLLMSVF